MHLNILFITIILPICLFNSKLAKAYTKKKLEKGPAFPVCISVNEIVGHYSPLNTDSEEKEKEFAIIKEGDVVKMYI